MKKLPIETKEQRLVIYKEALLHIKKCDRNEVTGLCLILRHLSGRDFNDFIFIETSKYFIEFGKFYNRKIRKEKLYMQHPTQWREWVLTECIKMCS